LHKVTLRIVAPHIELHCVRAPDKLKLGRRRDDDLLFVPQSVARANLDDANTE
jgi:hypothetical protein